MVLVLGPTDWIQYARLARGEMISLREQEFVQADYALGSKHWHMIWRHILPNCIAILITVLGINLAGDRIRDRLDPKVDERSKMMMERKLFIHES